MMSPNGSAGLGALLRGTRSPLHRALVTLDRDRRRISTAFRSLLKKLTPNRDAYSRLVGLDPLIFYRSLSSGGRGLSAGDDAYRLAVEQAVLTLMRAGVPEDHVIASVGLHLEACLGTLKKLPEARSLVRVTSITQFLVASAYSEDRVAGLRQLDDRERQKVSGDLHDEVGADLVVLKLYVEMIASELASGSHTPLAPKLDEALALIAHAIESVRRLTLDLGPAFLDTLGFLPALRNFVRQFSQRTGITVKLEASDSHLALPASHETALYRVLLGALSNVAKHSSARTATVTLGHIRHEIRMVVEDDGRGFDAQGQSPHDSFGLQAMRERVRGLRGRLFLRSWASKSRRRGTGTRLEVRLPLRKSVRP